MAPRVSAQDQPAPAPAGPSPDAAPPPPPVDDRWWESHRPVPRSSSHARTPLVAVGAPLLGVGALTLLGSGVAWLIAFGAAQDLEEECPNRRCVEGTPGGRAYVRARDGAVVAEVMAAVGLTALGAGIVVLSLAIGTDETPPDQASTLTIEAGPTGGAMEVRF